MGLCLLTLYLNLDWKAEHEYKDNHEWINEENRQRKDVFCLLDIRYFIYKREYEQECYLSKYINFDIFWLWRVNRLFNNKDVMVEVP